MLEAIKRFICKDEPVSENAIYQREWTVYQAFETLLTNQPCTLGGKYSWLASPSTGRPLQIDIFYVRITQVAGVDLAHPKALAIEVQSSLHDGKWNKSKKRFFRDKASFDMYTRNQEYKRQQLLDRGIPFLEIDPSKDDLSPKHLRRLISEAFGLRL